MSRSEPFRARLNDVVKTYEDDLRAAEMAYEEAQEAAHAKLEAKRAALLQESLDALDEIPTVDVVASTKEAAPKATKPPKAADPVKPAPVQAVLGTVAADNEVM